MVVLTAETCWAMNEYWINNKISGIKLVFFSLLNYKDDARSHKHKIYILHIFHILSFIILTSRNALYLSSLSFSIAMPSRGHYFLRMNKNIKAIYTTYISVICAVLFWILRYLTKCHKKLFINLLLVEVQVTLFIWDWMPNYDFNLLVPWTLATGEWPVSCRGQRPRYPLDRKLGGA